MRNGLFNTSARALTAVVLVLAASLAGAASAGASRTQATILQDDAQLVSASPEQRSRRLDELKAIGVDIVKVRLSWRFIAPGSTSTRKPSGFDGSNPAAYREGAWAPYDAIAIAARERGMGVLFQLGGSAPEWATPGRRRSAVNAPSAAEFRAFVKAVGTRYSGSYGGSGAAGPAAAPTPPTGGSPLPLPLARAGDVGAAQAAGALPRVTLFSVWNEPNLRSWLAPQYRRGVPYSPYLYRRLLYAAADGLRESGHGSDPLLLGELQPYAGSRTGTSKVRPLHFLRELACLDRRYRPYRGRAAKRRGCGKRFRRLPGTGVAYHPYTLAGGPRVRIRHPDDASINSLGRVTKAVDRIARRGRIGRRLPLWVTEFGFQSSPPDRFATPLRRIPGYMALSERIAWSNGRVRSYAQYPLVDDRGLGGFQSGLRFAGGRAKPVVYNAFRHTIHVRRLSGSRVSVFGTERAAGSGSVTIEAKRGRRGKWRAVGTAQVNSRGYFSRTVRRAGAGKSLFRFRFGTASSRAAAPSGR